MSHGTRRFTLSKRKILYLSIAGVILVLVGITIGVVRYFSTPAQGTLLPSQEPAPKTTAAEPQPVSVTGKRVTFSYVNSFTPATPEKLTTGELEKFAYRKVSLPNASLNITIRSLPSNQLSDEGTYKLRQSKPETYAAATKQLGTTSFTVMTDKTGGFNKVAYATNKGQVAIISMSSSAAADDKDLQAAFDTTLKTWQWR